MKKNVIAKKDIATDAATTEEKIRQSAKKLFTMKGFAAVTTREIAKESGINLALLHYYFRSKDKLFEIIMLENLSLFIAGVASVLNNEQTTLEQKLEGLITTYIDKLSQEPELPLFIVNQINANPEDFVKKLGVESLIKKSYFLKQLLASDYSKMVKSFNPLHIMMNTVGLTVAPFLMAPVIQKVAKLDREKFLALVGERKALIPEWILAMVKKGSENK